MLFMKVPDLRNAGKQLNNARNKLTDSFDAGRHVVTELAVPETGEPVPVGGGLVSVLTVHYNHCSLHHCELL